ncbi:MAG TPA: beta-propeller domain-containing protein [Gaiellaceae bacterium]|nr:beta-propeller domain-containing protein [Gaiellaceae bacterium]
MTRLRILLPLALAALAVAAPASAARSGRLVAFRSCPDLLGYAKAQAGRFVGPYGLGAPLAVDKLAVPGAARATAPAASADSAPQEGVDYSGTNVQETGVDEPDLVKTNGNTLFAAAAGQLQSVDVTGKTPKLLDTLKLDDGWSHELLLSGTHLLVLSRGGYWAEPLPATAARMLPIRPSSSTLTEVDVSDPSDLRVVKTLTLDGAYVDARMIGTTVRVVSSSPMPVELPFVTPSQTLPEAAAKARNQAVVARSRASAWLPSYRLGRQAERPLVQCRDVLRPRQFSGLGMLTVTTIDLAKGLAPVDTAGLMTDARIVYASPTKLFVATERWSARPDPATPDEARPNVTTEIHAFDISDASHTTYLGSGSVPGYLLNQWSLSDFQDVLRVVSTDQPAWWGGGAGDDSQSYLTTFRAGGGKLTQVGQLGGLGQGERVYAVRFIGETGYVVTFKQVDPLHTLDVSDPAHPQLLGALTIPGYSAYLHPVGDGLLLGIGQDVGDHNEPTGTQVSLFDVSDLKHPTRLYHYSLGRGWSAAESDHHAFLYWPATGLVVVPFGQSAVGMKVDRASGVRELGRIVQTDANASYLPQIERALVVRDTVLTVSDAGVKSNSLSTLASLGWAAFPTPPAPTPVPLPSGVASSPPKASATGAGVAVGK